MTALTFGSFCSFGPLDTINGKFCTVIFEGLKALKLPKGMRRFGHVFDYGFDALLPPESFQNLHLDVILVLMTPESIATVTGVVEKVSDGQFVPMPASGLTPTGTLVD